jgi:hypothetical protein
VAQGDNEYGRFTGNPPYSISPYSSSGRRIFGDADIGELLPRIDCNTRGRGWPEGMRQAWDLFAARGASSVRGWQSSQISFVSLAQQENSQWVVRQFGCENGGNLPGAVGVLPAQRHLMPHPIDGRWSGSTGRPASTASTAARTSAAVTGRSFRGRESSSWPR